jgi:hypothetical protein
LPNPGASTPTYSPPAAPCATKPLPARNPHCLGSAPSESGEPGKREVLVHKTLAHHFWVGAEGAKFYQYLWDSKGL